MLEDVKLQTLTSCHVLHRARFKKGHFTAVARLFHWGLNMTKKGDNLEEVRVSLKSPSQGREKENGDFSSYLLIGFERWFGRLRLRHFVTQEIQHLLGRVPLGHLLAGAHPLRGLAADRHLRGVESRDERCQEARRCVREQPAGGAA